jgi:hypothetical protein
MDCVYAILVVIWVTNIVIIPLVKTDIKGRLTDSFISHCTHSMVILVSISFTLFIFGIVANCAYRNAWAVPVAVVVTVHIINATVVVQLTVCVNAWLKCALSLLELF